LAGNACVHRSPVVCYEVDMNMKTKITLVLVTIFSLISGASLFSQSVAAAPLAQFQCPDGLHWSIEDKKCQKVTDSVAPNSGNGSVTCPSGYKSTYDSIAKKTTCIKTQDTNVAPCPEGEQGRGSGKPGCWKESNSSSCLYGNATTVNEDQCWSAGTPSKETGPTGEETPSIPSEAKDKYVKACVASGKTEAQCKTSADAIEDNCADSDSEAKAVASCIAQVTAGDFGTCSDGSKPSTVTGKCADGSTPRVSTAPGGGGVSADGGKCGGATTAILDCGDKTGDEAISEILRQFVLILSVGVGIVAVGGIVFGAVLYASARDNASQTQQAIGIIRNTVIGILMYIFMVSLVNWLIPGGVIG